MVTESLPSIPAASGVAAAGAATGGVAAVDANSIDAGAGSASPLLHLLHLASPTLPIGAYAYSQGLEAAVAAGYVQDASQAGSWVTELLTHVQARLDVPILARLYTAWRHKDALAARAWSESLLAQRESRELQDEDHALGASLARLLRELGVPAARELAADAAVTLASAFALAAAHWSIALHDAAAGYLFAWIEGQIAAATKLVPLGQTEAQRALLRALGAVPKALRTGLALDDDEIGAGAPGLGLLSAAHETQYTRLFRS